MKFTITIFIVVTLIAYYIIKYFMGGNQKGREALKDGKGD